MPHLNVWGHLPKLGLGLVQDFACRPPYFANMTAKPLYLRLKLRELIDEIADRATRTPIQILNQFHKAPGLLEDELPGTELNDLFEPDVRQSIITWINIDKRVSTQHQKLRHSPWGLDKDGIYEQFDEAMSRSIRFLSALAQLSEMISFETAQAPFVGGGSQDSHVIRILWA